MSEPATTLNPEGRLKASTIVAEPVMTQYQALRHIGFVNNFDFIMLALIALCWVTLAFWKIFAEPSFTNVLGCALVSFGLLQVWSVSLLYRCMHFVILTQAYINTLPQDAARIVMSAYAGGAQPKYK